MSMPRTNNKKATSEKMHTLFVKNIQEAKAELMLLLVTSNSSNISDRRKNRLIDFLRGVVHRRDIKVRVLFPQQQSPTDDKMQKQLEETRNIELKFQVPTIAIDKDSQMVRSAASSLSRSLSLLLVIIDRKMALVMCTNKKHVNTHVNDDVLTYLFSDKTKASSPVSYTLCSNKTDVLTHIAAFETIWKQTELYDKIINQNKTHEEFVNLAAHELRTPIQPILFMVQMLLSKIKESKQHELLEVIDKNAKKLQRLADDILEVTRIESGTLILSKEVFNLNDLVYDIVQDFKNNLFKEEKSQDEYGVASDQILLFAEPDTDLFFVEGDKVRLAQVISNLLDNSLKFTHKGTVTLSLHKTHLHGTDDKNKKKAVEIRVKDTGSGIDPEILPRLFTKFATKSYKGTGLGLFISKSIVEAHHGKIWAENNEKSGCTFHFLIPIEESLSSMSLSRKSKVLLVDQDSTFTSNVKVKLEANNQYEVHIVTDALTALDSYISGLYDLVILGIDLPGISAFDLCQQIRQRDKKVKVCFLTAANTHYEAFRDIYGMSDTEHFLNREELEKGNLYC